MGKNEELYLICDDTDEQYVKEHMEEYEEQERRLGAKAAEIEAKILKEYGCG